MSGSFEVHTTWLALPLSARGLLRELTEYGAEDVGLRTCLTHGASSQAVGNEIARLLCAHRGEHARIRRDVELLTAFGLLSLEGSTLRVVGRERQAVADRPVAPKSTSAERMRRHRELARASRSVTDLASHVTVDGVTRDAGSYASEPSLVTDPLSLDRNGINSNQERARDGRDASHPMPADLPFSENARAIAARVGVKEPDLTWMAFKAYYLERGTSAADWERVWETWVVREVKWEGAHGPRPVQSTSAAVDLDAPWLRAAGGDS